MRTFYIISSFIVIPFSIFAMLTVHADNNWFFFDVFNLACWSFILGGETKE